MELYDELQSKSAQLDVAVKRLRKSGTEYAEAEKDYKICLREEVVRLREEGMPVGIIDKAIYGVKKVAELRLKRDIALTVYEANKESIAAIKLQIRLIDNQISREWGQAGRGL